MFSCESCSPPLEIRPYPEKQAQAQANVKAKQLISNGCTQERGWCHTCLNMRMRCRLSYNQGWRKNEWPKEAINSLPSSSFHLWMHRRLVESIPNTIAKWMSTNKDKFKQLFVSYGCSIARFHRGCKLELKLDACFLSGYYRGHCLKASAHDNDDRLYLLAYAVVSSENDED
ncbi:hypothetical protein Vadar_031966 [Vaccinium darrowii]|uniref:Uncharacterized protein n=1 Tax=Vaccinium darrowii TaxID=229202 RepID=A0ACB7YHV0_9ERIC|nr:hypothetical protein Vadar_031966 [Vaccinium darrowii]